MILFTSLEEAKEYIRKNVKQDRNYNLVHSDYIQMSSGDLYIEVWSSKKTEILTIVEYRRIDWVKGWEFHPYTSKTKS